MSATPVEQPGQGKDLRVGAAEWASAVACFRRIDPALPASDPRNLDDPSVNLATLMAILHSSLARLEAAEGEGARLRRTLEAMLDPSWWREDVDVNGEYTTSRALGYYELVPRIQEALAQSEGLPS